MKKLLVAALAVFCVSQVAIANPARVANLKYRCKVNNEYVSKNADFLTGLFAEATSDMALRDASYAAGELCRKAGGTEALVLEIDGQPIIESRGHAPYDL